MRKKIFIIIITLSSFTIGRPQTLVDTNKLWSIVNCSYYMNPFCLTDFYRFQGDTIIGLNNYKKLFTAGDSTALYWNYFGAMRQDSDKKVYYHSGMNENLLYDFELNKNDTINLNIHSIPIQLVVDSVDTVVLLNGEKRRRLLFDLYNEQWIEGIGSMFGLTNVAYYLYMYDASADLNCFKENDTLKYHNINYPTCNFSSGIGISETTSLKLFSINPNPFTVSTTLSFSNPNHEECAIKIYDMTGQLVRKISHVTNDKLIIEKEILKSGLYLFVLTSDSHFWGQEKLIIE